MAKHVVAIRNTQTMFPEFTVVCSCGAVLAKGLTVLTFRELCELMSEHGGKPAMETLDSQS